MLRMIRFLKLLAFQDDRTLYDKIWLRENFLLNAAIIFYMTIVFNNINIIRIRLTTYLLVLKMSMIALVYTRTHVICALVPRSCTVPATA